MCVLSFTMLIIHFLVELLTEQQVKVIWQKAPHMGPFPA